MSPARNRRATTLTVAGTCACLLALIAGGLAWHTGRSADGDRGLAITSQSALDAAGFIPWPGEPGGVKARPDGSRVVASRADGTPVWERSNGAPVDLLVPLSDELAWVATSGNPVSDGAVVDRDGTERWVATTSGTHLAAVAQDVAVRMDCRSAEQCTWTGHAAADGTALWEVRATGPVEATVPTAVVDTVAAVAADRQVPTLFATFDEAPAGSAADPAAADAAPREVRVRSAATGETARLIDPDDVFVIAGDALLVVRRTPDGCTLTIAGRTDVGPVAADCRLREMTASRSLRTADAVYVERPGAQRGTIVVDLTTGRTRSEDGETSIVGRTGDLLVGAGVQIDRTRSTAGGGHLVRDARTGEALWTLPPGTDDDTVVVVSGDLVITQQDVPQTLREAFSRSSPPPAPVRLDVYRAQTGELLSSARLDGSLWTGG